MSSPSLRFEQRGDGPPLLLMHGLGSSLRVWDPVRPLLEAHMDVIAIDLPGHGGSPLPPSSNASKPGALALTIAAFLDRLGIPTAHLAGNSLGGWLALELAKIGRARSVTALSPAGLWRRTPTYHAITFHAYRALAHRLKSTLPYLAGNPVTRTILLWQFFGRPWALSPTAAMEAASALTNAPGFDAIFAAVSRERFRDGNTIDVPVSIAWGGRDVFLLPWQARRRDELPPGTRWTTLRRCGHVPTFDDPQAVADIILSTARSRNP